MATRNELINLTPNLRDRKLIARCYDTLMSNVYEEGEYLWSPYRCTSPGKGAFKGIWNWDSAFHAMGFSRIDPTLAKENIIGFLKFQREDGLLPDVIFENGRIVSTFTKPPVFAYAVEKVYKSEPDLDFLKEVYPYLVKNEKFWVEQRCYKGLFFYDADNKDTPDYNQRVRFESGWDNSVRWDNGITEYWAIDLNCFMVMFYRSMRFIANELGKKRDFAKWKRRELTLTSLIQTKMWKKNIGFFDVNRYTGELSEVCTPASFMPLFIKIANQEQAEIMNILAEQKFEGKMPTVSFDNENYSTDYWRGPTWLNVAYFAAKGLKNYDFKIADTIKENILDMCDKEKNGIFENYDSKTGKGLCCNRFSWSSVFIMEFILDF